MIILNWSECKTDIFQMSAKLRTNKWENWNECRSEISEMSVRMTIKMNAEASAVLKWK